MTTEDELVEYLAQTGANLENTVLIELEGDESGDEPEDEHFGELLILPTEIISITPVTEENIAAVHTAANH